ncbi:carbohydrate binding domain-containing protein [Brevibacillus dissolubilis]|uniref:carbohydrate binding domain-containing protein n=1 Tax=Brevibacillus dissolubilis TaxID=1844116 RepID=UPI001C3F1F42|nr:carbohydrate binding domain-containing protein [Brevibacillus dissolubilis]
MTIRKTAVTTAAGLLAVSIGLTSGGSGVSAASSAEVYFSSEKNPQDCAWFSAPMPIPYTLSRQADISVTSQTSTQATTIYVDPAVQFQSILGVGTSLEESTIYNISRMTPVKREEVLRKLVDPVNGAGMNLIRICFGTADFTGRPFYTYDDMPTGQSDPNLTHFSIQKDIDYNIIATLKQALAINPNIKIFASAWSAPAWMKDNKSLIGGRLLSSYIPNLATYYRKAIQAYQAQGIPIYAMTIQNEPLYAAPDYPSMLLTPDQERQLVTAIKKELDANTVRTKLWTYGHNFSDAWNYVPTILNDSAANAAVDAIAFHDYAGSPGTMTEIHNSYNKNVLLSERSVWGTAGADRIAQYFRNWAISYNAWATMLDSNIAPEQWTGTPNTTMLIQSASSYDNYWAAPEYYLTGQFSKFVKAGAERISSNYGSSASVTNVAFLNLDNTIVTVVVNQTANAQKFKIVSEGQEIVATLPAKTVGTYKWPRAGTGTTPNKLTNFSFESGNTTGWTEWSSGASAQKADMDNPFTDNYKLTHYAPGSYQQLTSQVKAVPNGTYQFSAWVRSGGGQKALHLFAKGYGGAEMTANIGTNPISEWTKYTIDNITVTNGQIEVGVWDDANTGNWAAFDQFELVASNPNLLNNPSFETGNATGWTEWSSGTSAQKVDTDYPYIGTYKLTHYSASAYQQLTSQIKTVPNGTYKISGWVRSGGGQKTLRLFAKDYGGAELTAEVGTNPVTNWTPYTIDNINVTSGQIEVGVWNDANANNWAAFDSFELIRK